MVRSDGVEDQGKVYAVLCHKGEEEPAEKMPDHVITPELCAAP